MLVFLWGQSHCPCPSSQHLKQRPSFLYRVRSLPVSFLSLMALEDLPWVEVVDPFESDDFFSDDPLVSSCPFRHYRSNRDARA